jgi:radical SAM protein (TIGR01212 family)
VGVDDSAVEPDRKRESPLERLAQHRYDLAILKVAPFGGLHAVQRTIRPVTSDIDLPFRTLRPWLVARYGRPVHRVALDAGSTCPNRDGTKGFGGCTYCDVEGSGTGALRSGEEIERQLELGIARIERRDEEPGVIAYLQSYSNTYVSLDRLREVLGAIERKLGRTSAPIVAVSVATRPDTLSDDALEVLCELSRRVDVWIELGLESADDRVLERIRRFHTLADFEDAVRRVRSRGLVCIGHAILGLPGDGSGGALRTAEALARTGVDGVKVHNLMVLRRTQMEKAWRAGEIGVLDLETYVPWLADFVERLQPEQVIHRTSADARPDEELAPRWRLHANEIRERLARELGARGTRQGSKATASAQTDVGA